MKRDAKLPSTPGVFAVVHTRSKHAYVGKCKNLRQRASMWAYHLRRAEEQPEMPARVRGLPKYPANEWAFLSLAGDEATVRQTLTQRGFTLINSKARTRTTYVIHGIEDTLVGHARRLGVNWDVAYKRVERGATPEQALGVTPYEPQDLRDQQISMMRVKLVTDEGGWVTYDEAVQMKPELGDIRRKVQKWRAKNPEATEIKISDIT